MYARKSRLDGRTQTGDEIPNWSQTPRQARDVNAKVLRAESLRFANTDILELGCGTGINTVWFAQTARSVVAMDVSAGMLTKAKERVRQDNVWFVQHDIRDPWPVNNNAFDILIATLVWSISKNWSFSLECVIQGSIDYGAA